ncbi:MAG: BatD family protein [Clostridium sp.]|nr:BatD family protein [Clostridium sp.]
MLGITLLCICAHAQMPAPTIKSSADSSQVEMGDIINVKLDVVKNSHQGALVGLPEKPNSDYYGLELQSISADSTDLGNGRVNLIYTLRFQAFEPKDLLTLPPFFYAIGEDTLASDVLSFKILPVALDPALGNPEEPETLTIHPDEPPIEIPLRWYDYVPNWWYWALIGIAAIALAVVLALMYKKNGPALFTPKHVPTPYEVAVDRLRKLKERRLLEQGQAKAFYTDLIDTLRGYLQGRFGINAMEMTSKQILQRVKDTPEIHLSASQMRQVLELADFVKFAAAVPDAKQGMNTFSSVSQFIESTKPAETTDDAEGDKKKKKQ